MTWARPTRSVWRAMAIALWVAAIATVAVAVWLPYDVLEAPSAAIDVPATLPTTAPSAVTFDDVLDLDLRRPLVDLPTTGPAAAVALVPTAPDVRLAGIVAEPGHSFAVFVAPTGSTEVRAVGQRTGGTEVLAISPAAVTVRFDGRTTTLRLAAAKPQ